MSRTECKGTGCIVWELTLYLPALFVVTGSIKREPARRETFMRVQSLNFKHHFRRRGKKSLTRKQRMHGADSGHQKIISGRPPPAKLRTMDSVPFCSVSFYLGCNHQDNLLILPSVLRSGADSCGSVICIYVAALHSHSRHLEFNCIPWRL